MTEHRRKVCSPRRVVAEEEDRRCRLVDVLALVCDAFRTPWARYRAFVQCKMSPHVGGQPALSDEQTTEGAAPDARLAVVLGQVQEENLAGMLLLSKIGVGWAFWAPENTGLRNSWPCAAG